MQQQASAAEPPKVQVAPITSQNEDHPMQGLLSTAEPVETNSFINKEKDKCPAKSKSAPKAKVAAKKRGGAAKCKQIDAEGANSTNDTLNLIEQINALNLGGDN